MAEAATALVQTIEDGHLFYAIDYDPTEIEVFFHEAGFHNGPGCAACEMSWCEHCTPGVYAETCWAVASESAGARITRQWQIR